MATLRTTALPALMTFLIVQAGCGGGTHESALPRQPIDPPAPAQVVTTAATTVARPHPAALRVVGSEIRDHGGTGEAIRLRGVNLAWIHLRTGGLPHPQSGPLPAGVSEDQARTGRYTSDSILSDRFGVARKNEILEEYLANWISTADLDIVVELGLNLVRVPFSYKTLMEEDGSEKPDPIAFRWMDWVLTECSRRGIHVLFDLHMVQGTQNTPRPSDNPQSYWNNRTYQERAVRIWQRVAERYRGNPWVAGFELLNEPYGIPVEHYKRFYQAIRAIDPERIIFVQTWGIKKMPRLQSVGWTNVVCNVHFYPASGKLEERLVELDAFCAAVAAIRADPTDDRKMPIHIGEFNMSAPEAVRAWEREGFTWTMWQWKFRDTNEPAMIHASVYMPKDHRPLDLANDSAERIIDVFRAYRTPVGFTGLTRKFKDQLAMPVARNDALQAVAGKPQILALVANDHSLGAQAMLEAVPASPPGHGSLETIEGRLTYTPGAGFVGTDSFTYRVLDRNLGALSARPATVTITVIAP